MFEKIIADNIARANRARAAGLEQQAKHYENIADGYRTPRAESTWPKPCGGPGPDHS